MIFEHEGRGATRAREAKTARRVAVFGFDGTGLEQKTTVRSSGSDEIIEEGREVRRRAEDASQSFLTLVSAAQQYK
ncbi:hypothetical protein AB1Y20_001148 [Prymnesium parvum]|uniref:Uncharacterized protein n=1 Tax=Prymnesium parvum TaxID=97485 RepID=A0AB34KAS5_PRYPA